MRGKGVEGPSASGMDAHALRNAVDDRTGEANTRMPESLHREGAGIQPRSAQAMNRAVQQSGSPSASNGRDGRT